MAQRCGLETAADGCAFRRNRERSTQQARLDGLSILRTSLPASDLGTANTVRACHRLSRAERACRSFQIIDLQVQPIPRLPPRARAPPCLAAYARLPWRIRRQLAPLLFDDLQAAPAQGRRPAYCGGSAAAQLPHASRRLGAQRRVQPQLGQAQPCDRLTRPTPLQRQALNLLGLRLERTPCRISANGR